MKIFEGWDEVGRIIVSALLVYPFLIATVRIIGKRSVAKMNNYDWIVTVAMGSMCASVILLKDVVLADGVAGLTTVLFAQWAVTKLAAKYGWMRRLVQARSTLLYFDGEFLDNHLLKERVTRSEIRSAIRSAGLGSVADAAAVLLESSGDLAVVKKRESDELTSLQGVEGWDAGGTAHDGQQRESRGPV